MSLFEFALASLQSRARRDGNALCALACSATRQRITFLQDSVPPEKLWQWQQDETSSGAGDDTQAVIERLFADAVSGSANGLAMPEFQLVDGATRRARLRFHLHRSNNIGEQISYSYYVVMEREQDGVWRYFNTTVDKSMPLPGSSKPMRPLWFATIGMAEDAARNGGVPLGADASTLDTASDSGFDRPYYPGDPILSDDNAGNDDDDDDDDDAGYWAMYDSATPAKVSTSAQLAASSTEDDYWARYGNFDSQTPPSRKETAPSVGARTATHLGTLTPSTLSSSSTFAANSPQQSILQSLRSLRLAAEKLGIDREEFVALAHQV